MTAPTSPMRILWLSPWLRPLARVQVEALRRRGHEVLLVTSDQHPEAVAARDYELVVTPGPKNPRTWVPTARAWRTVRRFDPDVVVAELVRDPRWIMFGLGAPLVTVVHDDRPHDAGEQRPGWERALFDAWARRSAARVVFSQYVAARVPGEPRPHVLPLTSDLDDALVPARTEDRRDFVLLGRLRPYKNVDVTLAAWRRHVAGPAWAGDDLLLIGAGEVPADLPPHVRHVSGSYSYRDVVPVLAAAKASIAHYRQASQSGVQVLAMQLGVTSLVSPEGALPEFQPSDEPAVGVDDVAALAAAFDDLARPGAASERGARARAHYETTFAVDLVAAGWESVLSSARAAPSTRRRARRTTSRR